MHIKTEFSPQAMDKEKCIGAVVCKLDIHKKMIKRGYIAMLAVDKDYRRKNIGSNLVLRCIKAMACDAADEVIIFSTFSPLNLFFADCSGNRNHE